MTTATAPIRKYSVLYSVTRGEYYEIESANPEEAEQRAFSDGQLVETGETTDVSFCQLDEIARSVPSDPVNGDRAEWAEAALRHFQSITGSDDDDALADLLGDLIHWSDRNNFDFDDALARARTHHEAETSAESAAPEPGVP